MGRERCTELCAKPTTGQCSLCDALDARDAFWQLLMGGFLIVGWRALWWFVKQAWQVLKSWFKHFGRSIVNEGGYRIVIGILATLVGAYFGLYAVVEAKHERHLNRVLFERSAFMTMVVSGPSGFRSAMDQFVFLQHQIAPVEPEWSVPPWKWFGEYKPNVGPLRQWAYNFMSKCEPKTCGKLATRDETGKIEEGSKSWPINLGGANLRGADLRGADLGEAYLGEADLREADLREADLGRADLRGADLQGTSLREANLREAYLWEAYLWGANLREANLRRANLRRANLRGANLRGANLRGASLWEANLRRADLRGADLWGADLGEAGLGEADLRKADLRGAHLWKADLRGARLQGTDLRGADLRKADLWGANLRGANLRGADLRGADLRGAHLRGTDLWEADLNQVKWDTTTWWPNGFKPRPSR